MIKFSDNSLILIDDDGEQIPFSADELQTDLIRCFLAVGDRDNSIYAEDISLAVEYSLLNEKRKENILPFSELSHIVGNLLENFGFIETADYYRQKRCEKDITLPLNSENFCQFFIERGIANKYALEITKKVLNAFKLARIDEVTESLLWEMGKFFKAQMRDVENKKILPNKEFLVKESSQTKEDVWKQILSENSQELFNQKILKIADVRSLHPSIRIFLKINSFAEYCKLSVPLTEMELAPVIYELAKQLDECCQKFNDYYKTNVDLPIYFNILEMKLFLSKYFQVEDKKGTLLTKDIIEMLTSVMETKIYKLSVE